MRNMVRVCELLFVLKGLCFAGCYVKLDLINNSQRVGTCTIIYY